MIPGAADSPPAMLAARQAIALANWYVTIPRLILAVVSGAFMVANAGYLKRSRVGMHIAAAAGIAAIAAAVLVPAALELEAGAKAVAAGTMTPEAFEGAAMREYAFGAVNIFLTLAAIALGATLPRLRKGQS